MTNGLVEYTHMKGKEIALLIDEYYQELEVWYPYYRLTAEGANVFLVGHYGGETYSGKHGYPHGLSATADTGADAVDPGGIDAVVIPGGFAPDYMRRDHHMVDLVRGADERGKVVAAICHGVWVCASADILEGRQATCFSGIADDITHAGADYRDVETATDGNLITARTPDDLPVFTNTIIDALTE